MQKYIVFAYFLFAVSPSIRVPNQLLGAPLNTDVQLECTVEAYPNTVNYWDKNGEIIFDGYVLFRKISLNSNSKIK